MVPGTCLSPSPQWQLGEVQGPSALVSVDIYSGFSNRGKNFYRLLRHPLMLVPGGFFYLVIKPRLELLAGPGGPDAPLVL